VGRSRIGAAVRVIVGVISRVAALVNWRAHCPPRGIESPAERAVEHAPKRRTQHRCHGQSTKGFQP
jgi:hypothetical protein